MYGRPPSNPELFKSVQPFVVDGKIIRSQLQSYFPEMDIRDKWNDCLIILDRCNRVSVLYALSLGNDLTWDQNDDLKKTLEEIKKYLSYGNQINLDRLIEELTYNPELWHEVTELVQQRGDEIIKDVMKLSGFYK